MTAKRLIPLRLLTALAVCAVCLPTIVEGARVAAFAAASARLASAQDGLEALRGWRDVTGVAADARDPARMKLPAGDADALARQRNAIKAYLAVKPLAPVKWLALADADLALGAPAETTVRAFAMSLITGPYEGYLMPRRALIGALLWEKLGPDERIGTARDLALADLAPEQDVVLRGILAAMPKATHDAIRFEMLQIEGLQADRLAKIGLQ